MFLAVEKDLKGKFAERLLEEISTKLLTESEMATTPTAMLDLNFAAMLALYQQHGQAGVCAYLSASGTVKDDDEAVYIYENVFLPEYAERTIIEV
jgi:hypothetical protein